MVLFLVSNPVKKTADFLDTILSRITLPGSIFLGIVAIMPAIVVRFLGVSGAFAMFFGGTSLLIMVGCCIGYIAADRISPVNEALRWIGEIWKGKKVETGLHPGCNSDL